MFYKLKAICLVINMTFQVIFQYIESFGEILLFASDLMINLIFKPGYIDIFLYGVFEGQVKKFHS